MLEAVFESKTLLMESREIPSHSPVLPLVYSPGGLCSRKTGLKLVRGVSPADTCEKCHRNGGEASGEGDAASVWYLVLFPERQLLLRLFQLLGPVHHEVDEINAPRQ